MSRKRRRPVHRSREGPKRSKRGFTRLAPESWKYASVQNVSQTGALDCVLSKERESDWHRNPGSLREVRKCHRPVHWFGKGPRSWCLSFT